MMKSLCLILVLAACGAKQPTSTGGGDVPVPVAKDTRTPLEKRRDAACENVAKRNTQCAVEDAKRDLDAGKVTKAQFDEDTKPDVQHKLTQKYLEGCEVQLSSRQVRVLEVCFKEETECDPFLQCLTNIQPKKPAAP